MAFVNFVGLIILEMKVKQTVSYPHVNLMRSSYQMVNASHAPNTIEQLDYWEICVV